MRVRHIPVLIAITFFLPLDISAATEAALMPAKGSSCKNLPDQWESIGWRCAGPAGFSLLYTAGNSGGGIGFGRPNQEKELTDDVSWSGSEMDMLGLRAEWRMANGRPYAAIVVRQRSADRGPGDTQVIEYLVAKVTDRGACAIGTVGALSANGMADARKMADERGASFRCGIDKPSLTTDDEANSLGKLDGHFGPSELLDHNGSMVELTRSDRGAVEIRYRVPRKALQIQPDTLLFSGQDSGGVLTGIAYVFKKGCEAAGYQVTGRRQNGVLVLEGAAPHRDKSSCRVISASMDSKHARLEFDYDPMLGGELAGGTAAAGDRTNDNPEPSGTGNSTVRANGAPEISERPARQEDPAADWKKGKLERLSNYAGTYSYQAVLNDPEVARSLEAIAGKEQTQKLKDYMFVMSPIALVGPDLVLKGNAQHRGGEEEATIWVSIYDGSVRAALLDGGVVTMFAHDTEYRYLPEGFRSIVRRYRSLEHGGDPMDTLPQGVSWMDR